MTAVTINLPPVATPQESLSQLLTPGEYVDGGGSVPSDLPGGVLPGWHLIVENPEGSVLTRQTLVSAPLGGFTQPYPEIQIFIRYYAPLPGHPNTVQGEGTTTSDTQWTSWQQVPA